MKLLKTLVEDQEKNDKSLYSSGPYWNYKNKRTLSEIKRKGLEDFGEHLQVLAHLFQITMF